LSEKLRREIIENGRRVIINEVVKGFSTTRLKEKIKKL
jgi:hypothetical protein